jgi:uncharacterized protein (TIGR00645 family)
MQAEARPCKAAGKAPSAVAVLESAAFCAPALAGALHLAIDTAVNRFLKLIGALVFWSRWLQAPLYLGLIAAQCVYVYHFAVELTHLVTRTPSLSENEIMLIVLGLIDVVMIANLLIMVIVGGYETFVSRLNLDDHPDQPEWLSKVNPGVLKIKLATALVGISSIHLLKTFINAANLDEKTMFWQVAIHLTFVGSAVILAITEKLIHAQEAQH